jgi:hypothetical protein
VKFRGSRDALWSAIATSYAVSALVYGVAYVRSREFWKNGARLVSSERRASDPQP